MSTMQAAIKMALMRTMPQEPSRTIRARTLAVSTSSVGPQVRKADPTKLMHSYAFAVLL